MPMSKPAEAPPRPRTVTTYPNGRIPAELLCPIPWSPGDRLRCDAAAALNAAAEAGMPTVHLTDSYRSLAEQYAVAAERPGFAAPPGTSNHGLGIAIDVPEPARSWLAANGAAFGWINPAWALPGGSGPYEPWHFEYVG
ncbi:hypothetical protein GCM10027059_50410 [Myceligenerans halotolerans]